MDPELQVDSHELQSFEKARSFTDNKGPISAIDFHRVEDLLVTAGGSLFSYVSFKPRILSLITTV